MEKYIDKITEVLAELERRGEIVITTTIPRNISEEIYYLVVKYIFEDASILEEPIESTLPYLLEKNISTVESLFSISHEKAYELVGKYHKKLLQWNSPKEVAQLYWHQGSHDMALRAYYTCELNKNDHDIEYLNWRKGF